MIVEYGKSGDWTVYANNTPKDCYFVTIDCPNAVQMGLTKDRDIGYLGTFTKKKLNIKNDSKADIIVDIGGDIYEGIMTGTYKAMAKGKKWMEEQTSK